MPRSRSSSEPEWTPALTPARPAPRERRDEPWPPPPPTPERAPRAERAAEPADEFDVRDLERGRTAALLAALGRLQMSVDVNTRNQQRAIEEQKAAIRGLEIQIADLAAALAERDR